MADVDFHNRQDLNDVSLEGEITDPNFNRGDEELSTLDEPVKETVMRDVRAVGSKLWHVLYPKQSRELLKEWDLWGPLILCTIMAMMLQGSTEKLDKLNDGGPEFAEVFLIYWLGAVVVTLNTKLLGGNISFFQSVCVLGYCVSPLTVALIVCRCVLLVHTQTTALFVVRFMTVLLGFGWSIWQWKPQAVVKLRRKKAPSTKLDVLKSFCRLLTSAIALCASYVS
ncbi:hypothetical protein ScPMuIL_010317 [Solemya velum]